MGVQTATALKDAPVGSYLAIEIPEELIIMTVHEYMELPRSMLSNWLSMRLIIGEAALLELLKQESLAAH